MSITKIENWNTTKEKKPFVNVVRSNVQALHSSQTLPSGAVIFALTFRFLHAWQANSASLAAAADIEIDFEVITDFDFWFLVFFLFFFLAGFYSFIFTINIEAWRFRRSNKLDYWLLKNNENEKISTTRFLCLTYKPMLYTIQTCKPTILHAKNREW